MSGIHIDEFYADAARTIVSLYSVFPRPVTVFVEDICGPDQPDEYGVHSHRHQACFATLLWLADEGFIRYNDTIRQDAIDQVVLSGRCFTTLMSQFDDHGAVALDDFAPSIQRERSSMIHHIEQALKGKASVEIQNAFFALLQRMIN